MKKVFAVFCILACAVCVYGTQPNIVFIMADDLGWQDVSYQPGSTVSTPNIDTLAQEGVKLNRFYAAPVCSPSRSQLMSGLYPIHTGLQHDVISKCRPHGLPLAQPTLANKLKDAGYSTHLVGKWHLGHYHQDYLPANRGFDTFTGFFGGGEDYYTRLSLGNRFTGIDFTKNGVYTNGTYGTYSTHLFADEAQSIIASHNTDSPLFLYLAFQTAHTPLQVPQDYLDPTITDPNRRNYTAMVKVMDEAIGNVTESLKDAGMWDNTILVFSSDNGGLPAAGASNDPLRGRKGQLFEGGIRVVSFVSGPLLSRQGAVSDEMISMVDWYPTLVNLAGGQTSGISLDGYDVWDTIDQGQPSPREEILYNIDPLSSNGKSSLSTRFDTSIKASLRYKNWKIITGSTITRTTTGVLLYDVDSDPEESRDLSSQETTVLNMMIEKLADYNDTAVPVNYPNAGSLCDPALHNGFWKPWL